jgi:uncharacterized protein (DUF58 family)
MSKKGTLFDDEFLKKLEYLNIVSNQMIPGHMHGEHRAKKKTDAGIEFADYRQYVSGEDTRNVDWRTYLRLDKLILRMFEEDADLPIYIFFDASKSMDHGEPSKYDYARKIAAALCYIGLLNHDRVNLVGYADGIAQELSARRGKNQVWHAFRFLESVQAAGPTSMQTAFKSFFSSRRRRGLVVVVSDFLDGSGWEKGFDMLRYFRQDLFVVHVYSADEMHPELPDEVLLEDSETGKTQRLKVTPGLLDAYGEQFEEHCEEVNGYCRKNGYGYVRTTTELPFEDLVLQVFRQGRFLG